MDMKTYDAVVEVNVKIPVNVISGYMDIDEASENAIDKVTEVLCNTFEGASISIISSKVSERKPQLLVYDGKYHFSKEIVDKVNTTFENYGKDFLSNIEKYFDVHFTSIEDIESIGYFLKKNASSKDLNVLCSFTIGNKEKDLIL